MTADPRLTAQPSNPVPLANVAGSGFSAWIDRVVGLFCLALLVPTLLLAQDQLRSLHTAWLALIGGGVAAASFLMPLYAGSPRGIRLPAALYSGFVLLGVLTWPLGWSAPVTASGAPWLWMCVGLATVCVALVATIQAAVAYSVLTAACYVVVLATPSGGSVPLDVALQDALMLVAQPVAILLLYHYMRAAVRELDASLVRSHRTRTEAAVDEALMDERRRLDGVVHDEVMTTLVAASQGTADAAVHVAAAQARQALRSLDEAEEAPASASAVGAEQAVALLTDVVAGVCPAAEVTATVPPSPVFLPRDAVVAFTQAVRQAAQNAEAHARADHVRVNVVVDATRQALTVQVDVTDDGVGFRPDQVSPDRLGIRVSVQERMRTVGGTAEVWSAPGRGTVVALRWAGERGHEPTVRRTPSIAAPSAHPLLSRLSPAPFIVLGAVLTALYCLVGLGWAVESRRPIAAVVAVALAAGGAVLGFLRPSRPVLPPASALAVAAAALAVTGLALAAMPASRWPDHASWFAGVVMILSVILMGRSRPAIAWTTAVTHATMVIATRWDNPDPFSTGLVALLPVGWLVVVAFLLRWFDTISVRLAEAEHASEAQAAANAAVFSKLVLREVWLADLRAQTGRLLQRLADPDTPITAADRAECLIVENTLRDAIRAGNLASPGLAAAIAEARLRGVTITLVDNRGSRLPEQTRRVTVAQLEAMVRAASSGRIVARTAPEGYPDAVTILEVEGDGTSRLITIDTAGTIGTTA